MSNFSEGQKISFKGFKGNIVKITETYKKNVLVVKVTLWPKEYEKDYPKITALSIFEYPTGDLELMLMHYR